MALRPGSWWTLALGIAVGLALLAVFAWPRPAGIDRLATALEAQGTPSSLRETFGVPARTPYDAPQDESGGGYLPL